MQTLIERGCGLDVHQATVVACLLIVRKDRKVQKQMRTFGTTTRELVGLREWLLSEGCTHVAMESTGVYWKPIYAILEGALEIVVANAQHIIQTQQSETKNQLDCERANESVTRSIRWIFPAARNGRLRRADCACGTYAAGPRGRSRLGPQRTLPGGSRASAARPRPFGCPTRNLSRLHSRRCARSDCGGRAFVLPSFLMVLGLSAAYVRYGGLPWMQGMFYGIGAAVIGIITRSAFKLTKLILGKDKLLWAIFAVLAVSTAWTSQEIIWLFLLGGAVNLLARAFPTRLPARSTVSFLFLPGTLATLGISGTLLEIFVYFAKAGLFVFGSGLAVVPFLYGGVVQGHHWLTDHQFVDAVAVAMITPGPVVITVAFIGYLVAGVGGATAAALGIFLPVYIVVVLLAPSYKLCEEPAVECVRARRHRGGHRRDCGCDSSSRSAFSLRSTYNADLCCQPGRTVSLEGS